METTQNQMIYLAAWGVIKKLIKDKRLDIQTAEKLNKRNAEQLMCDYLPIC